MERRTTSLSPAKALLIQWRALWAVAYAIGKTMTLAQYRDPRRASDIAEMLEVWTRFAIFTLIGQIAVLDANCEEDAKDISHLRGIVGALAMLCALAGKVRWECAGRMGHASAETSRSPVPAIPMHATFLKSMCVFDYFDSG